VRDLVGIGRFRSRHPDGFTRLDLRASYTYCKAKLSFLVNNVANAEYTLRPGLMEAPRNIAVAVSDTVLDVESTGVSELSDELDVEPTRQVIETDVPDAKPESEVLAATPSHSQPSSARPAVTEEATEDTDNSRSNTNNDARASDTTVTATES